MTVTIHSSFKSKPRISRGGFVSILQRVGSFKSTPLWGNWPETERPHIAEDIYDNLAANGHDPAVFLGILGKESSFGVNQNSVLWRNNTRSWTNARSVRHPDVKGEIITDSYRRSNYVRYQDVRDSVRDGWYRVDDPNFAYRKAGANTIAEVIAIWAPADDANDPTGYAQTMVKWIQEWAAEFPPGEKPMDNINGVPFRVSHIPRGNPNRPGHAMMPEWITVHETGNPNNGANAEMHRQFVNNGGGASNVSWHYTVDDKEIIQHLPLIENGWHAGDGGNGNGNRKSIGIEMCINTDGDWGKTMRHTAKLVAHLQDERGFADNRIVQHNHWSGKNCPARLRASNGQGWRDLLTMIPAEREVPVSDGLVLNRKRIIGGFKGRYEALGKLALPTLGLPVTEEFTAQVDGVERTVQLFERGVLGWFPEGKPHGVKPSNPMHVRNLTIWETTDVSMQAVEKGLV